MSKFVIEEQNVESLKENYNKVIFQKQMVVTPQSEKVNMESQISLDRESPGIVKRRIMEMSSLLNGNSSSSNLVRPLKRSSSPARPHFQLDQSAIRNQPPSFKIHPSYNTQSGTSSSLFLAPKPFKSLEPTKYKSMDHTQMNSAQFDRIICTDQRPKLEREESLHVDTSPTGAKQRSVSFKSCTALPNMSEYDHLEREANCSSPPAPPIPKRSASLPRNAHKPAIPPKPQSLKMSPTKGDEEYFLSPQHQRCSSQDYAAKFTTSEEEDKFDPVLRTSFSSPDQQKFDLLRRRQSYSELQDLIEKKRELRERMLTNIMLLREDRDILAKEKLDNDSFGQSINCLLEHYATPQEISKYNQYLEEIEQITKLTVGLTIRLSRLNRKIETGQKTREELAILESKKSKLEEQTLEAELLHRNTDRRGHGIRKMLAKYLNNDELVQYDAFLVNLIKFITDLKETEQRIQLGEEQLVALNDNLDISS